MKFKLQADGREYEVSAAPGGTVTIDGQVFECRFTSSSVDRRLLQVGEKTFEVRVVDGYAEVGCFTLEVAGERVPVTASQVVREGGGAAPVAVPAPPAAPGAAAESAAGAALGDVTEGVWAPVPGKIVDVLVKAGDSVEEGQALIVLEAMKMENELRSPKKAKVRAVLVNKGDQAEKGQLLVALE
jgi:biotin carboxyl carrier protein